MVEALITRRSFLKYCGGIAATLGLSASMIPRIAEALTSADTRLPVVWLHFAECTGCSESFLRATDPHVADILFDVLNITYHETIQVACGEKAEYNRDKTVQDYDGQFICVVEGAIPTADDGVYGMVGGKTMLEIAQSVIPRAKHTICFGTCSAYGGLPAAAPNPTGAKGVRMQSASAPSTSPDVHPTPESGGADHQLPAEQPDAGPPPRRQADLLPRRNHPFLLHGPPRVHAGIQLQGAPRPTTTAISSSTTPNPGAFRLNISASAARNPGSGTTTRRSTIPCGPPCLAPIARMPFSTKRWTTHPARPAIRATCSTGRRRKRTSPGNFSFRCIRSTKSMFRQCRDVRVVIPKRPAQRSCLQKDEVRSLFEDHRRTILPRDAGCSRKELRIWDILSSPFPLSQASPQ